MTESDKEEAQPLESATRAELIPIHEDARLRWKIAAICGACSAAFGVLSFVSAALVLHGLPELFGLAAAIAFICTIGHTLQTVAREMQIVKYDEGKGEVEHVALRPTKFGAKLHLLSSHSEYLVYPPLKADLKHVEAVLVKRAEDGRPVGWIIDGQPHDVVGRAGYMLRRIGGAFFFLCQGVFFLISVAAIIALVSSVRL